MNVIVTGASRGIGKEVVKFLAENGHQVLALSRNITGLEELRHSNTNIVAAELDLNIEEINNQVNAALTLAGFKNIDVLVNNAGHLVNKPFISQNMDDIYACYNVNVIGVIRLIQLIMPYLNKEGSHCVNISSMGGFQGSVKFPGLAAYSSSKAAVASLTECLAEEYKDTNHKFNCLALGAVQTEMLEEAFSGYKAPISAPQMAEFIANFAINGHHNFNGKILPVSISTP